MGYEKRAIKDGDKQVPSGRFSRVALVETESDRMDKSDSLGKRAEMANTTPGIDET